MTGSKHDRIVAIDAMSAAQVVSEWERVNGTPAPAIAPSLLARDLAHRVQLAAAGGIDKRLERRLADLVGLADGKGGPQAERRKPLSHGTQLLREWGGQTHRVSVEADGRYGYAGKSWQSLSAIAREITGAHWSGPRFFGTRS